MTVDTNPVDMNIGPRAFVQEVEEMIFDEDMLHTFAYRYMGGIFTIIP